jgi:hypothetical protein
MLAMPFTVTRVRRRVPSLSVDSGETPGLSSSPSLGAGFSVGDAGGDVGGLLVVVESPGVSDFSFWLVTRSLPVVVGTSQGAWAMAANRERSTVGSPAKVLGSATSTDRPRVPGRSPRRAMESARNRWMVTAPDALDEVCATVLLRGSS